MKDPEIDLLIQELETRRDMTVADFDGVLRALAYLLPGTMSADVTEPKMIDTTDEAMLIADHAFPNWSVTLRGRANDKDGHWRCTLRKSDGSDSDAVIGAGHSPVLGQAVLAAVMRLAMATK
jgi:hypothetical protein